MELKLKAQNFIFINENLELLINEIRLNEVREKFRLFLNVLIHFHSPSLVLQLQ